MKFKTVLKTISIILGFIMVVLFLGYIIYSVFFREAKKPTGLVNVNGVLVNAGELPLANENVNRPPTANVNAVAQLPVVSEVAKGGATLTKELVDKSVDAVTIIGNNLRYYDKETGQFYQISPDGKIKTLLSDELFPDVKEIAWSPDASQAVLTFPDGTNILYNFSNKTQATLPKEFKEIRFSPSGAELGFEYVTTNPDNNFLGVSKPNGSEIQRVELLGDKSRDVQVSWSPTSQVMATFRKGSGAETQEVYFIGLHGENFKLLNVEGRGFENQWSKSGDQLLYNVRSASTNYNPELWVVDYGADKTGQRPINTGLKTWSSKCAIGGSAAFCGVPNYLPRGSGLYPELAKDSSDDFYKIDFRTGSKTKLASPVTENRIGSFNAKKVYLSPDESILYFIDNNTGKLHSIKLK